MAELAGSPDPSNPGSKLSDTLTMTFSGDTQKNSFIAAAWPDSTPGGRNILYVMSNGLIKPGWFGDLVSSSQATDFDPSTGNLVTSGSISSNTVLDGALAATLFATTGGDDRAVRNYSTADYTGIVNPILTG